MGDRGNIQIREGQEDPGVYLYSHWGGYEMPQFAQEALAKRWRWGDTSYLARIVFDHLTHGHNGGETGFGISLHQAGDVEHPIVVIDDGVRRVSYRSRKADPNDPKIPPLASWTYEEFIKLSPEDRDAPYRNSP